MSVLIRCLLKQSHDGPDSNHFFTDSRMWYIHGALTVGSGFRLGWTDCWILFIVQLLRRYTNQNSFQPADCGSIAGSSKLTPTGNISRSRWLQPMLTPVVMDCKLIQDSCQRENGQTGAVYHPENSFVCSQPKRFLVKTSGISNTKWAWMNLKMEVEPL